MLPTILFVASAAAIPPDLGNWETLQDGKLNISHATAQGLPWAKCVTVLPGSLLQMVTLLKDHRGYPDWMDRVYETRIYDDDIVHIILDMPFPLAHRDYVVKYTRSQEGEVVVFDFVAVEHLSATDVKGSVRLPRAEGQWRLEPVSAIETRVTYIWNGELLGDFPDWALTKAWVTQGAEVMDWLEAAL